MLLSDLTAFTVAELLGTHSEVLDELRRRNVIRSKNNPTGDYAEWLASTKLGLKLETNSAKGFDATDSQGLRYQIKSRRVTPENKSTQLGVIRNLEGKDFDFLVAVIFDANWQVRYAAKIPHETVHSLAVFRPHVNGHTMHLRPTVFDHQTVVDVSDELRDQPETNRTPLDKIVQVGKRTSVTNHAEPGENSMSRRDTIHTLLNDVAQELLASIKESESGFKDRWVPAVEIKDNLNLNFVAVPKSGTQYGEKGWMFAILARMLEDKSLVEHKKIGSRAFYRSAR